MYKQYVDDTFIYADIAYILYMCYIKCPVCIYYHKLQLLNSIYVCSLAYFFSQWKFEPLHLHICLIYLYVVFCFSV